MVELIKKLVIAWLKYNPSDEVQVWTFNHAGIEEVPAGYDIVVRIERWRPIPKDHSYSTSTPVPGYDATD
jgi:hypothetical protein